MNTKNSQINDRFKDPLGDHLKTVKETQSRRMARYPSVKDVYLSKYLEFLPQGKAGEQFLGTSDGVIGTELALKQTEEGLGFFSYDDRCVTQFEDEELERALQKGWGVHCYLAYSTYSAQEKSIKGTAVCFCYDSELGEEITSALTAFIKNTVDRIAHRSYLKLELDQEQFTKIIESKGQWYLIKEEPWPKLDKGEVFYRRRRTTTDRLIDAANRGNKGCLVASWIGLFVIIAGIALLVWLFFFR